MYIISNKEGEIPREGVSHYAKPISSKFEEILNSGTVSLESENDLKKFVKSAQNDRYYGINFKNVGKSKNTIEFRLPNGTIDADTWIENINLFGGIVRASEELAQIQLMDEADRTPEEQQKLDFSEQLKNKEISDSERLELLLSIVIPEENRQIYRNRYEKNSELLKQNTAINYEITNQVAKENINIKKIGRKVFLGEECVTGPDYLSGIKEIQKYKEKDEQENNL